MKALPRWLCVSTFAALSAVGFAHCSGAAPCNECPPVEGRYTLVYEEGLFSSGCTAMLEKPPEITMARVGSLINANYGSTELRGTLYDTYDMSLLGTETTAALGTITTALRVRYVAPLPSSDAGATLTGRVTRDIPFTDGGQCSVEHRLTGNKLP
jgi:hypothetical protein